MKILYICSENLKRPYSGCAQRSIFLYRALQELGEVVVFNPRDVGSGSLLYRLVAVPFLKLTKVAPWPLRSLNGVGIPDDDFDIVVCRYLGNAAKTVAWKIAPCYVDVDDVPTEAFYSIESKRLPRWMRLWCGCLVNVWQWYCLGKCKSVWVSNPNQKTRIARRVRCEVLQNIAREPKQGYDVNGTQDVVLMTVGLMSYQPNYEGVDWFLKNVWPAVHERWPDMRYCIAGGGLSEEKRNIWSKTPNVEVLGFVDDIDALYQKSLAVVAPVLSGAGTNIKVVESLKRGRVVFCTKVAARGYELNPGIVMFEDLANFMQQLDKWVSLSNEKRRVSQLAISKDSNELNSFLTFSDVVGRSLSIIAENYRKGNVK